MNIINNLKAQLWVAMQINNDQKTTGTVHESGDKNQFKHRDINVLFF